MYRHTHIYFHDSHLVKSNSMIVEVYIFNNLLCFNNASCGLGGLSECIAVVQVQLVSKF